MNRIKTTAEDFVVSVITYLRDLLSPLFKKYASYYDYLDYFVYGTYAIVLLGFYSVLPGYIPVLRNVLLYSAVIILLIRFNTVSWTNPKFALLGGNKFSEFDRSLILYTCVFILITHIVTDTVVNYTQKQVTQKIIQPVIQVTDGGGGGGGGGGGIIWPSYTRQ
jgi:hypothetical protein